MAKHSPTAASLIAGAGAFLTAAVLILTSSAHEANLPAKRAPMQRAGEKDQAMSFPLTTTAFESGGWIPKKYTCDAADVSPALSWGEPPAGTQSFALIADDPDAPRGTWVHWVVYNFPARARSLPEGLPKDRELPDGTRQGRNDFGKIGYNGPCPPHGSAHHYSFKLYAVDSAVNLAAGASKGELEQALTNHVMAQAEIVGRFQH